MKKRVLAVVLWYLAAAYSWNALALATDVPGVIAPLVGLGVAAFVGVDPLHLLWRPRSRRPEPR